MYQTSINFEPALAAQLKQQAHKHKLSFSCYIRQLVDPGLQAERNQQTLRINPLSEDRLSALHKRTLQASLETLYLTRFITSQIGPDFDAALDRKNFQTARNKALSVVETLLEQGLNAGQGH